MALTDIYTTPNLRAALSTAGTTTGLILGTAIDLTNAGIDIGAGTDLYAQVTITTAVTSAGAATFGYAFVTATDSALTAGVVTLFTSPVIAKASLVAGYRFPVTEIPQGTQFKRYCGFLQIIGTAALTAGNATCAIVREPQNWYAYDDNVN